MRISGMKGVHMIGDWKKLQNEGLHNLLFSSSISRMIRSKRMRFTRRGEHMKEKNKCTTAGEARRNTKTRPRREDNINMDLILNGVLWIGLIWIGLETIGGLL
jgi:hypothetical protein